MLVGMWDRHLGVRWVWGCGMAVWVSVQFGGVGSGCLGVRRVWGGGRSQGSGMGTWASVGSGMWYSGLGVRSASFVGGRLFGVVRGWASVRRRS